jgi:hypothetical protein
VTQKLLSVIVMALLLQPTAATSRDAATPQSVPELCRVREREILNFNKLLLDRNRSMVAERDPAKQIAIAETLPRLKEQLRETEESWQRLDCANLLYAMTQGPGR